MAMITLSYTFRLSDRREERFDIDFDERTLELPAASAARLPDWTRLERNQCANCPLSTESVPHCPAAVALLPLVSRCGKLLSFDQVLLRVSTPERLVGKRTTAQRGVSSLMGLLMAVSGCPHTRFFKPMARFHLPLASEEETIFRAASAYLLGQYFIAKAGKPADLSLEGLRERYLRVRTVNRAMADRIRAASAEDSTTNALILLDLLAQSMPIAIEESLERVRHLFGDTLE